MSRRAECVFYTQDTGLASRWLPLLRETVPVLEARRPGEVDAVVSGAGGLVVVLDLKAEGAADRLAAWAELPQPPVVVAVGPPRSGPAREAEARGVFATLDPEAEWRGVERTVIRALERADLETEVRALRDAARADAQFGLRPLGDPGPRGFSLDHFTAALRNLHDVEHLFQHVVDGLALAAGVSRVGLFAGGFGAAPDFRLRADRHCLADAYQARYAADHPLVRWLERNAHVVSRVALAQLGGPLDRPALARALDRMGAEALVPLFARGQLIGWFFVGHRADGTPFSRADLEALSGFAGPISAAIANALLYEELNLQKRFAETLLQAIPVGIVAVDTDAVVRWFNPAAERLLGLAAARILGRPVDEAGSWPADLLRQGLGSSPPRAPVEWVHRPADRRLAGSVFRLGGQPPVAGAMLLIEDVSEQRRLAERSEQVARSAFWTELAAAMAHEIRNPLVVIQTFAQLLPERHQDAEFREEFSREVPGEVARLASIADQIGTLARPRAPRTAPLDLADLLGRAVEAGRSLAGDSPVPVEVRILDPVPLVRGDAGLLADAIAHLVANALESIPSGADGRVQVLAAPDPLGEGLRITVEDNGRGIADDIRGSMFSPFGTTKARGMGLGLPIARRVALDHHGDLRVESLAQGTRVRLHLPLAPPDGLTPPAPE